MKKFLDVWLCRHLPVRFGLRRSWHELWIREDEFHPSLDIDSEIMEALDKSDLYIYTCNNLERRKKAHGRDLNRENSHTLPAS